MSTTVSLNGFNYSIPRTGDDSWSSTAGVDDFLVALSTGVLQRAGGAFTLTAEVNFGGLFGLKSLYYKSTGANPATAGVVRLANAESLKWRNAANSADLDLTVDASNNLNFNGAPIVTLSLGSANTALVMNSGGTGYQWAQIANANVSSSAAIAYSKLALTGSLVNADVASGAAIAYSKLALSASVVNADVSASAAIAYSKLNLAGAVKLASDVTDLLPTANGGTGVNSTATFPTSGVVVTEAATETLTNKTLTSPVISTIVNTGTLTLPTSTDTLVGRATTDTLTNKTISGSSNTITNVSLTASVTGTLPISSGGTGQTAKTAAYNALTPLTTKGDLVSFDGTNGVRVAVGADGTVLSADSSQTAGLKWISPLTNPMTAVGDVIVGGTSGAANRLATPLLGSVQASITSQTATVTIATPGVLTVTTAPATGATVYLTTTGALPTGLTASTTYYAINLTTTTLKLATSLGNALAGTAIATSGSQSGTHTIFTGGLTVGANGLPGSTAGTAIASGYIGQVLTSGSVSVSNISNAGFTNVTSISLTAGVWWMTGAIAQDSGTVNYVQLCISTTTASSAGTTEAVDNVYGTCYSTGQVGGATIPCKVVSISATTTYFLNAAVSGSATNSWHGCITAVRIA